MKIKNIVSAIICIAIAIILAVIFIGNANKNPLVGFWYPIFSEIKMWSKYLIRPDKLSLLICKSYGALLAAQMVYFGFKYVKISSAPSIFVLCWPRFFKNICSKSLPQKFMPTLSKIICQRVLKSCSLVNCPKSYWCHNKSFISPKTSKICWSNGKLHCLNDCIIASLEHSWKSINVLSTSNKIIFFILQF